MKKKNAIIILIVLLAVGFASVTTTLFINGTLLFGTNNDEFEVIFTKAIVDDINLSADVISEDGKTINYETRELAIVGDESTLDFTVKNNSTQYDAEIEINCIGGANAGNYYEITKTLPTEVAAQEKVEGNVVVTMIKSSTEEITEELTCTLNVTAVERDEEAELVPEPETVITWSDEDSSGTRTIGDIVTISKEGESSEQFYIISSDETNTTMMSMYNLYVGGEATNETGTMIFTPYENPTGIQDSTMLGYISGQTIRTGVIGFSSDEQKGANYSDYSGSIVESHVDNYSTYLRNALGIENSATLISKEELEEIAGSTLVDASHLGTLGAPAFLYSVSYWTRTAYDSEYVWYIHSSGYFQYSLYPNDSGFGVRPVVTIDTGLFDDEVTPQSIACEGICSDQDSNGIVTVGDIITLGDDTTASKEQFYVTSVSEDLSSVSMLSMYNLYVGGESTNETGSWVNTPYTDATGIQNSDMIGHVSTGIPYKGVTAFSSASSTYSGSIVEGYVNTYSEYLANTLGVTNTATLITIDELNSLECDSTNYTCIGAPSWVYSTSYWTGTSQNSTNVWDVHYDGTLDFYDSTQSVYFGVRPLVTINSSLIQA